MCATVLHTNKHCRCVGIVKVANSYGATKCHRNKQNYDQHALFSGQYIDTLESSFLFICFRVVFFLLVFGGQLNISRVHEWLGVVGFKRNHLYECRTLSECVNTCVFVRMCIELVTWQITVGPFQSMKCLCFDCKLRLYANKNSMKQTKIKFKCALKVLRCILNFQCARIFNEQWHMEHTNLYTDE